MEFKITIDNQEFIATPESFNKKLKKMELMYKYLNPNSIYLALIALDSKEAKEYVILKILEFIPNLYLYDFSKPNTNLKDTNQYIKTRPTLFLNIEEYISRLSEERNISIKEAKELVYFGINWVREGLFVEYKSRFIMIMNDEDYYHFKAYADDFSDYCKIKEDFNECFINKEGISLSDYYKTIYQKKNLKLY